MGKINAGRVIVGGLLAGLVVNISEAVLNLLVVAQEMEDALKARNLPPLGTAPIIGFVVLAFVLGIVTVWLYAAIRPRFGAGAGTAAIGGLAVWFFAYFYGAAALGLMELFPIKLLTVVTLWGLPEIVLASIAGAWAYKE